MICKICGKEFDSKGRHLRYYHNISNQEYYDKYILSNVSDKFCKICGKEKAFKSLNFGYRSCKKNESLCKDCYFKSEEYHIKEEYNKNRRKILNREKSKRNRKYKYVCKICNNGTDHMAYHLKNSHNMSYVDYCMQYYPEKLKSYCQKCGKKLTPIDNGRIKIQFYKCCKAYSEGAYKREEVFRNTIESNGKSRKHNIANRKESVEKLSVKMKEKNIIWTMDSLCHKFMDS